MKWRRHGLVGREAEVAALSSIRRGPALLVVRGSSGSGKTALLQHHHQLLADAGTVVLDLTPAAGHPLWDDFRAGTLLGQIREKFESLGHGASLAEPMEALSTLCTPESYASAWGRFRLLSTITRLLSRVRERVELVVLADDAERMQAPVLALSAPHRAGHVVIAACGGRRAKELDAAADQVVVLDELPELQVARLLNHATGIPADAGLHEALRAGLGPLYGNPGALKSTMEELDRCERLHEVHGSLVLRSSATPFALSSSHPKVRLVEALGPAAKAVVGLAADPGFALADLEPLAYATGQSPLACGDAVDQLVSADVLEHDGGKIKCSCSALGIAIDKTLAPRSADVVSRARELTALGDYETLFDHLTSIPRAALEESRREFAFAAALAVLHCERDLPGSMREALTESSKTRMPLAFTDEFRAGRALRAGDVERAFATESTESTGLPDGECETLEFSCAEGDVVPVFSSVLGNRYGKPKSGPVALHHQACRGYADGEWTKALSAARELELEPEGDEGDRHRVVARLLAAEICGWQGDDRQAAAWLASAGQNGCYPGLRAWVETGLRLHTGDPAFAYGWQQYSEYGSGFEDPGAARLLIRLAGLAAGSDGQYPGGAVIRAAEARYCGGPTVDLVRGLIEGNPTRLKELEYRTREHGEKFSLGLVRHRLAQQTDNPRPWLAGVAEVANSLGAARLLAAARQTSQERGVPVSVRRTRSTAITGIELQLVELIRAGKTNRQIALTLQVSHKTVEKHLTRLYAKAGCHSRHELAMSGLGTDPERIGA